MVGGKDWITIKAKIPRFNAQFDVGILTFFRQ